jgi:biopolymer transport protein ExbD
MGNSSFIIRFIDIGLIILFGFLIISDITVRSELDLSGSDSNENTSDKPKEIQLLVLTINLNGLITVSDYKEAIELGVYDDREVLAEQLSVLKEEAADSDGSLVALIEMQDGVTMQDLISILDLCDELGIPKNINVQALRL